MFVLAIVYKKKCILLFNQINSFLANILISYPLKISEIQRFSDVLRGYKIGKRAITGLKIVIFLVLFLLLMFERDISIYQHSTQLNGQIP